VTEAETDWQRIVGLYDAVAQLAPSPVIELKPSGRRGMAFGPAAALIWWTCFSMSASLKSYHLLPAVRGDL